MITKEIEAPFAAMETSVLMLPGQVLFREGDNPQGIYLLHSGSVELAFAARNGLARPLRIVTAGQIVGVGAIVMQREHDCTATVATAGEAGFIEREELLRLLDEKPALWFQILHILSNEVNAAYDTMRAMTLGPRPVFTRLNA